MPRRPADPTFAQKWPHGHGRQSPRPWRQSVVLRLYLYLCVVGGYASAPAHLNRAWNWWSSVPWPDERFTYHSRARGEAVDAALGPFDATLLLLYDRRRMRRETSQPPESPVDWRGSFYHCLLLIIAVGTCSEAALESADGVAHLLNGESADGVRNVVAAGTLVMLGTVGLVYDRRRCRSAAESWRTVAGLCPRCGYDLRASPDRCPECGLPRSGPAMVNDG